MTEIRKRKWKEVGREYQYRNPLFSRDIKPTDEKGGPTICTAGENETRIKTDDRGQLALFSSLQQP